MFWTAKVYSAPSDGIKGKHAQLKEPGIHGPKPIGPGPDQKKLQILEPLRTERSSDQAVRGTLKGAEGEKVLGIISIIRVIIRLHLTWLWRIPFCTVANDFITNKMIHMF